MLHEQPTTPVSAVKIDSDCMWHSPSANNLPFWPQVPALPNTMQHVPLVMAHLIGAIQSNAMKNPVRTFVFNYLSRNRYNNEDFINLLASTVGYFELLLTYTQGGRATDPNSAAVQAAADYSKIIAAILVQAYPQLRQYQNGEMMHEMNVCLEHHERVQRQVSQMRQQSGAHVLAPVSGNSMSMGAPEPALAPVGRAAPIVHAGETSGGSTGWGSADNALRGPDGLTPYERMTGQKPADLSGMHGLSHQEPFTNLGSYVRPEPAIDSPGGSNIPGIVSGGLKPRPVHITKTEVSFDEPEPAIRVVEMPPAELPENPVKLQPDPSTQLDTTYLHPDQDTVKGDFGETIEVASPTSTMRPTTNNRLVYDPTKYTACYQKLSDGTVSLVLADKDGDMSWNYQEHELDLGAVQDQIAPDNPNAPKVGLTAEGLASLKRTEEELEALRKEAAEARAKEQPPAEETEAADLKVGETGIITNQSIFVAHSHREAAMIAGLAILKLDRIEKSVNEYFYRVVKPMCPENTNGVLKDLEMMLEEPIGYERAFVVINERIDEGKDVPFWKEIDRRITDCFMNELHAALSLSNEWGITSFAEDYADLMGALSERFSPDFMDTIEASAKCVLIRAMDLLTEEQHLDYVNGLIHWGGNISDELANKMLVLSEFCCAVEIPVKSDDIKPFLETGILPEEAISFHKLLSSVVTNAYSIAADECPRIFLRLADQALFEVHVSRMVDNVYVLRPVQLVTQY